MSDFDYGELDRLTAASAGGDRAAFTRLHGLLAGQVLRWLERFGAVDVEECAQQVWLAAWRDLRPGVYAQCWLRAVCRVRARESLGRRPREYRRRSWREAPHAGPHGWVWPGRLPRSPHAAGYDTRTGAAVVDPGPGPLEQLQAREEAAALAGRAAGLRTYRGALEAVARLPLARVAALLDVSEGTAAKNPAACREGLARRVAAAAAAGV